MAKPRKKTLIEEVRDIRTRITEILVRDNVKYSDIQDPSVWENTYKDKSLTDLIEDYFYLGFYIGSEYEKGVRRCKRNK